MVESNGLDFALSAIYINMECSKCKRELKTKAGLVVHEKTCDGSGSNLDKRKKSAKWTCPKCNYYIHSKRERHVEICDGLGPGAHRRVKGPKGPGFGWAKGTKLSKERRAKISAGLAGIDYSLENEKEKIRRKKISDTMKKNPNAGGYRIGSGRCRGRWHESPLAGKVYLDSSYEYRFAVYLDRENIEWTKNTKKFSYIDESGKNRNYTPDFYLPSLDLWIETKGFETERDRCKWRAFPHKMKILFGEDIEKLEMEAIRLDEDTVLKTAGE